MATFTNTFHMSPAMPKVPSRMGAWLVYGGAVLTLLAILTGFWQVVDDVRLQADKRLHDITARHEALIRCEWEPSAQARQSCRLRVPRQGPQAPLASMTEDVNPPINMAYR